MINKSIYIVLSSLNMGFFAYLTWPVPLLPSLIFFSGIFLNHYFLLKGVEGLFQSKKKSVLLVLKFFVIIPVFIYAMSAMPEKVIFCVVAFIFQLIILALSIKRDNKKN